MSCEPDALYSYIIVYRGYSQVSYDYTLSLVEASPPFLQDYPSTLTYVSYAVLLVVSIPCPLQGQLQ